SRNPDAIMGRRRSQSTAGPLLSPPSLALSWLPVWPFPCGDRSLDPACPLNARVTRNAAQKEEQTMQNTERQDVYTRITSKIIASLEQGVRPWMKPWNAEHTAGRITRPLRYNGQPYSGINILMLWATATEQGFSAPIWMTFKQALELNAHV